jgi:hypothetical protein
MKLISLVTSKILKPNKVNTQVMNTTNNGKIAIKMNSLIESAVDMVFGVCEVQR